MSIQKKTGTESGLVFGERLSSNVEIQYLLEKMIADEAIITLNCSEGGHYTSTLLAANPERGTIAFAATRHDPNIDCLLASSDVVAELYLDGIKHQFNLDSLIKIKGQSTVLNAHYPLEIIRLQRRSCYRVQPLKSAAPIATLRHPSIPDITLRLRILDISLGGIALVLPRDMPAVSAGIRLSACQLQLDSTTSLRVDIIIHHIFMLNLSTEETRLGCELLDLSPDAEHTLHDYINHTQKRQYSIKR